jgi:hypothetical protein
MNEKEFSAQDMLDFASWFTDGEIGPEELQAFRQEQKRKEGAEYQRYLELKAKYEK